MIEIDLTGIAPQLEDWDPAEWMIFKDDPTAEDVEHAVATMRVIAVVVHYKKIEHAKKVLQEHGIFEHTRLFLYGFIDGTQEEAKAEILEGLRRP